MKRWKIWALVAAGGVVGLTVLLVMLQRKLDTYLQGEVKPADVPRELAKIEAEGDAVSFRIDRSVVTMGQYRACIRDGSCAEPTCEAARQMEDPHPAMCVGWRAAYDYCAWRSGSLPATDQWRRAHQVEGVEVGSRAEWIADCPGGCAEGERQVGLAAGWERRPEGGAEGIGFRCIYVNP